MLQSAIVNNAPFLEQLTRDQGVFYAAVHIGPERVRFTEDVKVAVPLPIIPSAKNLRVYVFRPSTNEWASAGTATVDAAGFATLAVTQTGSFVMIDAEGVRKAGTLTEETVEDQWSPWTTCIVGPATITQAAFTYDGQFQGWYSSNRLRPYFDTMSDQYGTNIFEPAQELGTLLEGERIQIRFRQIWTHYLEMATVEYPDGEIASYWASYRYFQGWGSEAKWCDPLAAGN
jgi:hypothetical protein